MRLAHYLNLKMKLAEFPACVTQVESRADLKNGVQLFPVSGDNDGFYYALLEKV